ncbi:NAD(P)H-hydrate dehydratase [Thermomonas brevis]|uniref:Bifunctional NAD(P)H-hydrate repair enzyme n=1 Tax=Thermomonas brevis TaxID=215691 RepID=A0A7G9QV73_9GAMM|nr:NAD(P)H-hydrate dehydratase [Thermomonas brevis]QNN47248.1 NAD(P)H-hydrate dehydratase [Thermomonas brevis]
MHAPLPLFDPAALRMLEARGTAHCDGDAFALMARAGQAAWRCALKHWPQAMRIAVVCGPGNNGGDGYVLARHAREAGRDVRVLRLAKPASALAQRACADYLAIGGVIDDTLGDCNLIVDALFGIGLSRAPDADAAALIAAVNAHRAPVLALDVPSGIDANSGSAPGAAVDADCTLQFLARHRGLRTGAALDRCGELELATLELPATVFDGIAPAALAYRADALPVLFPLRPRDSHKGRNGHVLCIGGDAGSGGAILLAAQAALRSGAGLVSVATRAAHVPALLARCPEAMVHAVEGTAELAPLLERVDVVAIGPGLGQGEWGRAMFDAALACGKPRVLDADALNLLAASGASLRAGDIVTPHPGEAARLLGCATAEVQRDRFAAAAALHARLGCAVVLKGAGSIVQSEDAAPAVICAGNPGMGTGGMGDLLTGVVVSLRGQGFDAHDAAVVGALLHAAAGDAAAREDGERGLLPSDLLPWLRRLANPVRR